MSLHALQCLWRSAPLSPYTRATRTWGPSYMLQPTHCTSSVGHAYFWGLCYSRLQLTTSVRPLWTPALTVPTQILPSCCLYDEKESPSDCRESGWVLQKARTDVPGPPCTFSKAVFVSISERGGNVEFPSAVTQLKCMT